MTTAEQWLQKQGELGRYLYLVLDSDGQLDERDALLEGREPISTAICIAVRPPVRWRR